MLGIFFGEFQCLPVDDCPAASCDSCVPARGSLSFSFFIGLSFVIGQMSKEHDLSLPEQL